ncbi:MAG TPA: M13 family metallopeptidase [Thermoanaerobaculia bacterium]|nr:M13 family metallopeptidase [Thermoanaerobaculia bacterium]
MDRSVRPGDDFFAYANGKWVKATEIPADRSSWGVFATLAEKADKRTADLIRDTAAKKNAAGSEEQKIADYYAAYMDEAAIEAKGLHPLDDELAAIRAIGDRTALARIAGSQVRADVDALNNTNFHTDRLFGIWVSPDFDHPSINTAYLMQGGLGMPDRDYYLGTDAAMTATQQRYRDHIGAVLTLAGPDGAKERAARIYDLEHRIAEAHVSRTESEDVHKANNRWTLADFASKAPGLDWPAFFEAAGLAGQHDLMVWQPNGVTGIAKLAGSEPLDVWKDYLAFRAIDRAAPLLPKAFVDENFRFYGTALTGAKELRARWKRAVTATNAALGEAVGKLYVKRYFPPAAKAAAQAMVKNIIAAFGKRIDRLDWMTPATRAKAKAKVATLYIGVGYPEKWRDYSGLDVDRGEALANAGRAELFDYRTAVARLGKPADKSEWWMTPQTVNAVNLPLQNALNFPAAILDAPFFDAAADRVLNYGGIGTVLGHEISHSFDDQGSQFDAEGRLANWWTPEDFAHFKEAADRLAAEFSAYEPLPGLHVNGELTLSENIADVAGISASYDGYRTSYGGKAAPAAQGFKGDQRFFLAFAQVWRNKQRPEAQRRQILIDGHAPAQYRAATVRNIDAWYAAFGVKPGEKLYLPPNARVRVW